MSTLSPSQLDELKADIARLERAEAQAVASSRFQDAAGIRSEKLILVEMLEVEYGLTPPGGSTALPLHCPMCGSADRVRKASAVHRDGFTACYYTELMPPPPGTDWPPQWVRREGFMQSELSRLLAPPDRPPTSQTAKLLPRATAKYDRLYYCARDDIVFPRGDHTCIRPKDVWAHLWDQPAQEPVAGGPTGDARVKSRTLRILAMIAVVAGVALGVWNVAARMREDREQERLYQAAVSNLEAGKWQAARSTLRTFLNENSDYKDVSTLFQESCYRPGLAYFEQGSWEQALGELTSCGWSNYRDTQAMIFECYYRLALESIRAGDWGKARSQLIDLRRRAGDYKDTQELLTAAESRDVVADVTVVLKADERICAGRWQDTGIVVEPGQEIRIAASGTWLCCTGGDGSITGPTGPAGVPHYNSISMRTVHDNALMGTIKQDIFQGEFLIGEGTTINAETPGSVLLSNSGLEWVICTGAGEGELSVQIKVLRPAGTVP